jgi:hypothetical protein
MSDLSLSARSASVLDKNDAGAGLFVGGQGTSVCDREVSNRGPKFMGRILRHMQHAVISSATKAFYWPALFVAATRGDLGFSLQRINGHRQDRLEELLPMY